MAKQETTVDSERLVFRTDRQWLASDLADVSSAVVSMYRSFISVDQHRRLRRQRPAGLPKPRIAAPPTHRSPRTGRFIRRLSRGRHLRFSYKSQEASFETASGMAERVLEEIWWTRESNRLRLVSISISSPGLAIFDGPGILREIRGIIRDLKFGIRQAEKRGELQIERGKLELRRAELELDLAERYLEQVYLGPIGPIMSRIHVKGQEPAPILPAELRPHVDDLAEALKLIRGLYEAGKLELEYDDDHDIQLEDGGDIE